MTEAFLHNIKEILIPHYLMGDEYAKNFNIYAETSSEKVGGDAVGAPISCGVDSLHTLKHYTSDEYPSLKLTHLFIGSLNTETWGMDWENDTLHTWEEKRKVVFDRYKLAAEMVGLPLVKMFTNIVPYVINPTPSRPTKENENMYNHVNTNHFITMAAVLSLRKLWRVFHFPSSFTFINGFVKENWLSVDAARFDAINMHVLGLPDFHCYSGGVSKDRVQKTTELLDYDVAQKTLHPCSAPRKKNCTNPSCGKCMRALGVLDYYDKLDEFADVFDVDRYKKNRKEYFWWFARLREHEHEGEFIIPVYQMLSEKYPEEMAEATKRYEEWKKPISRPVYDEVVDVYRLSMKMLSFEFPKGVILNFFREKKIKKLYRAGGSRIGEFIISVIENEIECVTYRTGNVKDCDAAFILSASRTDIRALTRKLKTDKPIYTVWDISKYLDSEASHEQAKD